MATDDQDARDQDARARTLERIGQVKARFMAGLPDRVAALCALARRTGEPDTAARRQAFDDLRLGLHNLSGGAPTLGLSDVGARASAVEKRVIAARKAGLALDQTGIEGLVREIEAIPGAGD